MVAAVESDPCGLAASFKLETHEMTGPFRTLACVAMSVALTLPCHAQNAAGSTGGIDLRPQFTQGQTLRYEIQQQTKNVNTGAGFTVGQTTGQTIRLRLDVVSVGEEQTKADLTYERLAIEIKPTEGSMGGRSGSFDSDKPADPSNPLDSALRPLLKTSLHLTLDGDGNITEIASDGNPGTGIAAAMGGKEAVQFLVGRIVSPRHGSGRASVGQSWTNQDSLPLAPFGSLEMTTTHTLAGFDAPAAHVNLTSKVRFKSSGNGATGQMNLKKANITGAYEWDTETGSLQTLHADNSFELGMSQQGIEMLATFNGTLEIRRLDAEADAPANTKSD